MKNETKKELKLWVEAITHITGVGFALLTAGIIFGLGIKLVLSFL